MEGVGTLTSTPAASVAGGESGTTAGDPSWLQSFVEYVRLNREVVQLQSLLGPKPKKQPLKKAASRRKK